MLLPVAVRSATVGFVAEQNDCEALPVGATGGAKDIDVTQTGLLKIIPE